MRRENLLARLLRALSGKTQDQLGSEIGVHPSLISQIELGLLTPRPELLARIARSTDLTVEDTDEVLRVAEDLRQGRRERSREADDLSLLEADLSDLVSRTQRRLRTLPVRSDLPEPKDRARASELFQRLMDLTPETASVVVQVAEQFQDWALCERLCDESVQRVSRDLDQGAELARLAREVAERVSGTETWRKRLRGYAAAHEANALRVRGELKAAEAVLGEARNLYQSGSDPGGVLDPGRLFNLEGALRRAQRRFAEAVTLLDRAAAVGRAPELALLQKGFTLEAMGAYDGAIETLLQAGPLIERRGDPRLSYMWSFNLAVNYCHLGRHGEAAELARQVRGVVAGRGDNNELSRVTWLEGRIAAGMGRRDEALKLLGQAREEFASRRMWYDVALALLEEAVLLLEAGQAVACKELARDLAGVFDAEGVHREALAALRLFQEAAEREEATAELARGVLTFLFRARYDEGVRYGS